MTEVKALIYLEISDKSTFFLNKSKIKKKLFYFNFLIIYNSYWNDLIVASNLKCLEIKPFPIKKIDAFSSEREMLSA